MARETCPHKGRSHRGGRSCHRGGREELPLTEGGRSRHSQGAATHRVTLTSTVELIPRCIPLTAQDGDPGRVRGHCKVRGYRQGLGITLGLGSGVLTVVM